MDYETKGGDESDDEEAVPMATTKGGTGHYAEASNVPMQDEMKVNSGHIAAVSSASSFAGHSPYDSMYGRGSGHTAGYQGHRASNVSTGSWKE